jgi:hypothetical protein
VRVCIPTVNISAIVTREILMNDVCIIDKSEAD